MKLLFPLLLAALPAFSATITSGNSLPRLFHNIEISVGGNVVQVDAGQIGVQLNVSLPAIMYSADPFTGLLAGPTPVTPIPDPAYINGARLAWLYNTYNPTLTQGWEAAALQLAIWEVILDNNDDDLTSGRAHVTGNTDSRVVARTGAMLLASAGQSSTGINFWVPNQGPSFSQTLLNASRSPVNETPEPAVGFLFGAGLLVIGALRRRATARGTAIASSPSPDTTHSKAV